MKEFDPPPITRYRGNEYCKIKHVNGDIVWYRRVKIERGDVSYRDYKRVKNKKIVPTLEREKIFQDL